MKKLFVLAALLMATPSAHAGNSISFQIEGHKIRVHAPRNCSSLSCIQISAPSLSDSSLGNFKGFKSKSSSDDADIAEPAPTNAPAPAPAVQAPAPQPAAPVASTAPAASPAPAAPTTMATVSPAPSVAVEASPAPAAAPTTAPQPAPVAAAPRRAGHAARHLGHRAKQGQRPDRGMRTEPVRLCREDRQEDSDQHEATGFQMDRHDSRSRQRPQLRLDDRDEGHQRAAGSGLRLWRHVLRRPDLEARQLKQSISKSPRGFPRGFFRWHGRAMVNDPLRRRQR